jgi:hypothetical protein
MDRGRNTEPMEPEVDGVTDDPGNRDKAPGETRLEKVLRERFGAPAFGSLMDGIVDKMFKDLGDKGAPETDGEAGDADSGGGARSG